jgi:hypothetical protein
MIICINLRRTTNMEKTITRRAILKGGLIAGALVPALGLMSDGFAAAALQPLDVNDPMAKGLNFAVDTTKVDDKANPTHKADQRCNNCALYQGTTAAARGGCSIFAGKSVPANGWCKSWTKKA